MGSSARQIIEDCEGTSPRCFLRVRTATLNGIFARAATSGRELPYGAALAPSMIKSGTIISSMPKPMARA